MSTQEMPRPTQQQEVQSGIQTKENNHLKAILACAGWACASSLLILLNAHLLRTVQFNYPILLCSLGQGLSGITAWALVHFGLSKNKVAFSRELYIKSILPIGLSSAGTLALGNAGYLFLSVSFIQMLKVGMHDPT